jgi:para-aminobenzoate synthetase component 1
MSANPFASRSVHPARHEILQTGAGDDAFLAWARHLSKESQSVVLLSGGDLDCSRYSIIGWNPFMTFRSKGAAIDIQLFEDRISLERDPLEALDELSAALKPDFPLIAPPFSGGAIGYFAYDLKNAVEKLPQTALDDLHLPDVFLVWPRSILIHDRHERLLHSLSVSCDGDPSSPVFPHGIDRRPQREGPIRVGPLKSNFSHADYCEAVRRVRDYIREGDVYQVNLSQRFEFPFEGDAFRLWESLFAVNPAPFYAFLNAGDHHVLSTSMERFLYRNGTHIETRPIKGTRKRGLTQEEDLGLKNDLLRSPKDDAELSMIVDLLRNDLGRICQPRTISVSEHKRLEAYQNVYHLISIVTGVPAPDVSHGDILRAAFPGGSITGCPKIRAMEIIDELEPHVRHVYTGSIGYLGWHENLDLNIAIRTGLIHKGRCCFSVGGGIVYDSREEDEYEETLHKGRTMLELIRKF